MDDEQFRAYKEERYETQVRWYGAAAQRNKRYYLAFQWAVIVLSASLPVLISVTSPWVSIPMSILLAIGTAALKTFKFQEHWVNYRTIAEALERERRFFDAQLADYREAKDKKALFVERVEGLISGENALWPMRHVPHDDETGRES